MKPVARKKFPDQIDFGSVILSMQKTYSTWSLDDCKLVAATFKTTEDWEKTDPLSYMIASDNDWLIDCISHMSTFQKKKASRAIPQSTRKRKQKAPSYAKSIHEKELEQAEARKRLRNKIKAHSTLGIVKKTKKKPLSYPVPRAVCLKSAFTYKTLKEWKASEPEAYLSAKLNGFLPDCLAYMEDSDNEWTLEMCIASAKHYHHEALWRECNPMGYRNAAKNGWLEACLGHMVGNDLAPEWRVNDCLLAAAPFRCAYDWRVKRPLSYQAALDNNWMNRVIFRN